jgi:hypothetical protein
LVKEEVAGERGADLTLVDNRARVGRLDGAPFAPLSNYPNGGLTPFGIVSKQQMTPALQVGGGLNDATITSAENNHSGP